MSTEQALEKSKAQATRRKQRDPEAYRAYMRQYMKNYRAKKRQEAKDEEAA